MLRLLGLQGLGKDGSTYTKSICALQIYKAVFWSLSSPTFPAQVSLPVLHIAQMVRLLIYFEC